MAKQSGLGATFVITGYDLSGDVGSLDKISGGPAALDVTSIKSSANERIGGLRDGDLQFTSWFDVALKAEHPVLSVLPTTDVVAMGWFTPAIGADAFAINGKQLNYDGTRGTDGSFSFKCEVQANAFGLEWGELLTAGLRTDTSATTGTARDDSASSAFGAQAYLEFGVLTGTDVTVKVEHSADNSTWATLLTFAQVTSGQQAQRVTVSNSTTVNRYLRATTTTSGGFTSATFAVMVSRNLTAVVF